MACFLPILVLLVARYSQALLLASPHETRLVLRPTSSNVDIAHITAPSAPELVRRALEKRDVTQTCGYFGTDSWVCDPSSYCGFGPSNFGCWGYNFTDNTFENYQEIDECFDAAEYSSSCAAAANATCSANTAWCNNPSASATECVIYILGGKTNHTAFACGATAEVRYGSVNSTGLLAGADTTSVAASTEISSVTATRLSTVTATAVSTVTVQSGAELNAKAFAGKAIQSIVPVALLHALALLFI